MCTRTGFLNIANPKKDKKDSADDKPSKDDKKDKKEEPITFASYQQCVKNWHKKLCEVYKSPFTALHTSHLSLVSFSLAHIVYFLLFRCLVAAKCPNAKCPNAKCPNAKCPNAAHGIVGGIEYRV